MEKREIKFRAWWIREKRMLPNVGYHPTIMEAHHLEPDSGYKEGEESWTISPGFGAHILMQYTGIRNEKGQEIYEGDVVKDDTGEIGIVRFGKLPLDKSGDCVCSYLAFYVECKGKLGAAPMYECTEVAEWYEVIGNIYENPELLTT